MAMLQRQRELCLYDMHPPKSFYKIIQISHAHSSCDTWKLWIMFGMRWVVGSFILYAHTALNYFYIIVNGGVQNWTTAHFLQLIQNEMTFGILTAGNVECRPHNVHVKTLPAELLLA